MNRTVAIERVVALLLVALFAQVTAQHAIIKGRVQFPDGSPFNVTVPVTLNHGEFRTYSKADGSFIFRNVPPGIHQVDVLSTTHHFGQVKVQLLEDSMTPNCIEYAYPGAPKKTMLHPINMTAYATLEYFEKKPGFSIFAMLRNPMVIMMLFSVGIMFLMPRLMEGLDPEEKARMREQMAAQQDPNKMLSNLFQGFTGETEEPAPRRKIKNSK